MPIVDFTDGAIWTENDPNADLTVTAPKCAFDTMRKDVEASVQGDYGAAHFGDFEHLLDIDIDVFQNGSSVGYWAVTNGSNSIQECKDNNDGITFSVFRTGIGALNFNLEDCVTDNEDDGGAAANDYYLRLERNGAAFTVKIYSTANLRNIGGAPDVDTLAIVCGVGAYRYAFGNISREGVGAATGTGFSENLDLQELSIPVMMHHYNRMSKIIGG